jgi:NAD(P)H-hydrate epimerase
VKLSTVSEMRAMDRTAIEQFGIAEELLMENAGHAVYFVLLNEFGVQGKRFLVFCGLGNNGGDGLVVARKIHSSGGAVKVFVLGDPSRFKGAARLNFDIVSRLPIEVGHVESVETLKKDLTHCDAIVDAILGTGITRNVEGLYRDVINAINRSQKPVFSVDIPSGVHGDTGRVMGTSVQANYTVTFGLPKLGNVLLPGYELGGRLYVSHISFPPSMTAAASQKIEINHPLPLPQRKADDYKGTFGQVLFVAGAAGYHGALSFLKAGGRYSCLAAPSSITPFLARKGSEIVLLPQDETGSGSIARSNRAALLELAQRMDMVVLGPGLSLEAETQQLVRELAAGIDKPLLIDGDGITAVCHDLEIVKNRSAETILTPHLDDMARISGTDMGRTDAAKVDILRRTAGELEATIVLKGAHSLIGYSDGGVLVNITGNPGMDTAGSGDVLPGTIAAMFGRGLSLENAVGQGVFVQGLAGDLAADYKGKDAVTAEDIVEALPRAMKAIRDGLDERLGDRYAGARVI